MMFLEKRRAQQLPTRGSDTQEITKGDIHTEPVTKSGGMTELTLQRRSCA